MPASTYVSECPRITGFATWEWDVDENICWLSEEWDNIIQNRSAPAVEGRDPDFWRERVHKEDIGGLRGAIRKLLDGENDEFDVIFRLQRHDGCWAWIACKAAVKEKKGDGSPLLIVGTAMDISWLRADAKFQQHGSGVGDAGYHAMLENSLDMFVRMDRDLFPLYINPVTARYMARERDEYSFSESLEELKIEPKQLEFLQKNIDTVFREGTAVRELVSFATGHGTQVTGEYSFWPEFDASGEVKFAMTHFRDLTEQVRAEQRARLNEQRLAALNQLTQMDNCSEADVLQFVLDSLLKLTNSGSGFFFIPDTELFGRGTMLWSSDHFSRVSARYLQDDFFPEDLRIVSAMGENSTPYRIMINGDGVTPIHIAFDGQMPVMRCIHVPGMKEDRVVCIAGVCNKLSDYEESDLQQLETFINGAWLILSRQRSVRELQRAKEAAEHANKVKDEFLANVSHELRTPLNGILSMLQLLEFLPLSTQQQEYVRAASFSGKALLRIISDILDFSRMESGRMELKPDVFDVKNTVRSTLQLFTREAENKGLGFSYVLDETIPDALVGDDARVRQIIFNIVGNALKFTEQGGISVECALQPTESDSGVRIYFSVKDTGIGIPLEQQETIFEAFTQVDSSSTRHYPGTGLGLSIVRKLVSMMDGTVTVESEVGKGTTIHVSLTLGRPSVRGLPCFRQSSGRKGGAPRSMDILVAEDDQVSRFAIRAFLQRAGHRPVCVANGRQALEAMRLHSFHCLFTDIQMPDMDGLELARRVRNNAAGDIIPSEAARALVEDVYSKEKAPSPGEIDPKIVIVAVSAHAMSGDRERFLQQGINYYISKPIVMDELEEVLLNIAGDLNDQ